MYHLTKDEIYTIVQQAYNKGQVDYQKEKCNANIHAKEIISDLKPIYPSECAMLDVRHSCLNEVVYHWEMPNTGYFQKWLYGEIEKHDA